MMGQQSEEAAWEKRDVTMMMRMKGNLSEKLSGTDGELDATGMKRLIFDEAEALAAPRGLVQRVFKEQQNRGTESFKIKCWAAADLQWEGGQWSGLLPSEYNEFRICLQYKCFISIQQQFGKTKTSQRRCQSLTESPRRRRRKKFSLRGQKKRACAGQPPVKCDG